MIKHKETLFERLGGVDAVRATIEEFYRRIMADERLSHFFAGAHMANLKMHQVGFFKAAFTSIPKDMDVAQMLLDKHMRLFQLKGLKAMHFDMVAGHLIATLKHLGISQELINEAVTIVAPLRSVFDKGAKLYGPDARFGQEEKIPEACDDRSRSPVRRRSTIPHRVAFDKQQELKEELEANRTLAAKLGGPVALRKAVHEVYQRLLSDEALAPFFDGVNVAVLKIHQARFLHMVLSDELPDLERLDLRVRKSHQRLFRDKKLSEAHFDRFMDHFAATLKAFYVERAVVEETATTFKTMRVAFEDGYFQSERVHL